MKCRHPKFGCPRIAQQISHAFGIEVNKGVVRRVLAVHFRPDQADSGPSWLTFIGHLKDGLRSVDLFRCESVGFGIFQPRRWAGARFCQRAGRGVSVQFAFGSYSSQVAEVEVAADVRNLRTHHQAAIRP
jgi:hypothetical protein